MSLIIMVSKEKETINIMKSLKLNAQTLLGRRQLHNLKVYIKI